MSKKTYENYEFLPSKVLPYIYIYIYIYIWCIPYCIVVSKSYKLIGGGNRGAWPLLNLRPLLRNVIFAIENHFSLAKCPPLLSVVSSPVIALFDWCVILSMQPLYRKHVLLIGYIYSTGAYPGFYNGVSISNKLQGYIWY